MTEEVFKAQLNPSNFSDFRVGWKSPSNIALVKYWGKKPVQIPANASLSFTLSKSCTSTEVQLSSKPRGGDLGGKSNLIARNHPAAQAYMLT